MIRTISQVKKHIKKWSVELIGTLLILGVLFFFLAIVFPEPPMLVGNYVLEVSDSDETIYLPQDLVEKTTVLFENSEKEWLVCLYGTEDFHVTDYKIPYFVERTSEHIVRSPCNKESLIGTLHNHNSDDEYSCYLSSDDVYSWGSSGYPLMGVICGEGEYAFYSKGMKRVNVEIY